eukprot:gene16655-5112_t
MDADDGRNVDLEEQDNQVTIIGLAMHHIYANTKKRYILAKSHELGLTGIYQFGCPGRVIVE